MRRAWTIFQAIWRRVENVVFGLLLLLIILYFLLQMPVVQNWLINRATAFFSAQLNTKIAMRHVDIVFFDQFNFEGFYVEDHRGDTLLYADEIDIGLRSNIFSLLYNKLDVDEIALKRATINITRKPGEEKSNLAVLLAKIPKSSSKDTTPDAPFPIGIRHLRLREVSVLNDDAVKGKRMYVQVPFSDVSARNIDIPSNIIDIKNVKIEGLQFAWVDYDGQPLPEVNPQAQPTSLTTPVKGPAKPPLQLSIDEFSLKGGRFRFDDFDDGDVLHEYKNVMDYQHMNVQNIDIQASKITANDSLTFEGILQNLSAREQSGFVLTKGKADRVVVSRQQTALYQTQINTPNSLLGDTIILNYNGYPAYRDFVDEVSLDIRLTPGSWLGIADLQYFDRHLSENKFVRSNLSQVAELSGHVQGKIGQRLRGENMNIRISDDTYAQFNFRLSDITGDIDKSVIEFDFDHLQSNFKTISRVIPGFKAPPQFASLGNIGFAGQYHIFFGFSHVLHGQIISNLAEGNVDMNLDLKNGRENATYSGVLDLKRFDLAGWTGNSRDFRDASFKVNIAEGSSGLTLPTVKTRLDGEIRHLYYKGYTYRNVRMNGDFREFVFDGTMGISDPNIVFNFDGKVNLRDTIPQFSFGADLRRLDVKALNLMDEDWVLSGQIVQTQLSGRSWRDLNGSAMLRNVRIVESAEKGTVVHRIDSLRFISKYTAAEGNYFSIQSDLLESELKGKFDLAKVGHNLIDIFSRHHPAFAARIGLPQADSITSDDRYEFNLYVRDLHELPKLFSTGLDTIYNVRATVRVDGANGQTDVSLRVPELRTGGLQLRDINLKWLGAGENAQLYVDIPASQLRKRKFPPITVQGLLSRDELAFRLNAEDTSQIVNAINLAGVLSTVDSLWQIKFNASDIALFNQQWAMAEDNYVRFNKRFFETREFEFFNGDRRILIDSFNMGKGMKLSLANFNLDFLNPIINKPTFKSRGKIYSLEVGIMDVFNLRGIGAAIETDTVFINDVAYGDFFGNVDLEHLEAPLTWKLFANLNSKNQLRLEGAYLFKGDAPRTVEESGLTVQPGEFQNLLTADDFPLEVLETFIPGISRTNGTLNGDVRIGGKPDRIAMRGDVWVDGHTQIDYLKSSFYIDHQRIKLSEYQIWAEGDTIWDASPQRLHMAKVRGGINHDHFRKWDLKCTVESTDNGFMVLNTRKQDNPLYYGQGIGQFKADFTGSFVRTNIAINAITGRNTRLFLPLGSATDISEVSFIKFKKTGANTDSVSTNRPVSSSTDLKGLNLEMNLTITEDAEMQLIFDEQAGDIIKSTGTGNIKLNINRAGEFLMYGDYTIRRGQYLFTLLNFVNKPFEVREGGTIKWYGDPYSAQIDLEAIYVDNTSPYNLLRDEILTTNDADLSRDAAKATRAVVTMRLKDDLMKPNISFGLDFPNMTGKLKTLADTKLRQIQQDQNELGRQVFGLVVVGSFLPSGTQFIQGSDYTASALNTLTQVLSNQLSSYLTGLASEWFDGSVSSINFDIAYNEYQNAVVSLPGDNLNQTGRELQLRLTSGFINDRITVEIGSQFGQNRIGTAVQDGFLGEELNIEVQLTENRHWRLKVYQRTEPDVIGAQRRLSIGGGIRFRREYETFEEMMGGLKGWFKSGK